MSGASVPVGAVVMLLRVEPLLDFSSNGKPYVHAGCGDFGTVIDLPDSTNPDRLCVDWSQGSGFGVYDVNADEVWDTGARDIDDDARRRLRADIFGLWLTAAHAAVREG